ncbi:hypothetical protein ABKV19_026910 [Rosa sericea]
MSIMVKNIDKENVNNNVSCDIHILDPKVSSTKGAPKRIRSGVEISSRNGNKRSRKVHEKVGDTNFDNNENTQDCLQDIGKEYAGLNAQFAPQKKKVGFAA